MAKGLTTRQEAILRYIGEYLEDNGFPPSIREIGSEFGIGSLRGVTVHLDALEKKGYIERANTPRSIKIIHPAFQSQSKVRMLPLLGSIAAGVPILAQEHVDQTYYVENTLFQRKPDYLLKVRGMSMRDAGIMDGDLLAVQKAREAKNGQIVVARLGDEVTVKRFRRARGHI